MASAENNIANLREFEYCNNIIDKRLALHLPVIPAILIIAVLSGLERRRSKSSFLGGRFGLVVPMGFLDGHRNRWSYTAAFVATAGSLMLIFNDLFITGIPVWAKVFMVYLQGLEIGIQCFPFFACIGTRFRLIGSICNTVYILVISGIAIATLVQTCCFTRIGIPPEFQSGYITAAMLSNLPTILAQLFLLGKSVKISVRCLITKQYIEAEDIAISKDDHNKTYLKVCLRKFPCLSTTEEPEWKFWQYRRIPGYLYPTRILCIIGGVFTIIYAIAVQLYGGLFPVLHKNIAYWEKAVNDCDISLCDLYSLALYFYRVLTVSSYLALITAVSHLIVNMLLFLRSYRRSMFKLFKGDKTFILTGQKTSSQYMSQSMRFLGYFIAYNLWGFIIIFVLVWVLCILDGVALMFLDEKGKLGLFRDIFLKLAVYPLIAMVLFYTQTLIAKRCLLQKKINQSDKDPPLAADNRKFYNAMTYYMLFVNVSVGIISCLTRTASSFIMALLQIGRLDKNLYLSRWHGKDSGYAAYVAMLHVDYTHNHPALRVFCSLLWEKVLLERQKPMRVTSCDVYVNAGDIQKPSSPVMTSASARSHVYVSHAGKREDTVRASSKPRILNRWQLAYTLQRNPSLIGLRRCHPPIPEETRLNTERNPRTFSSQCLEWAAIIVYKISVAFPFIMIFIMIAIPVYAGISFRN